MGVGAQRMGVTAEVCMWQGEGQRGGGESFGAWGHSVAGGM